MELNGQQQLKREKDLLLELNNHPNVVKLLGTGRNEENVYFIFELALNGSLESLIKQKGRLSLELTRAYACQMALAI
jgi:serine/threonine protein kinase